MAYNTDKCHNLSFGDKEIINSDKKFKEILKWCKKTLKNTDKWTVFTVTEETTLVSFKSVSVIRYIRFKNKEDYLLYKLSHID